MGKKGFALFCVLIFTLVSGLAGFASADRPAPEVVEGEKYVTDYLQNASALYVSGKQVTLDNASFYGAGYASDADITAQLPNQYGMCAVVLGVGLDTDVVLNNPTIESDPESYANGVFAAAMSKITVNGGTIHTNNSSGHGIDATYMGKVYAYDTVIHTEGGTSGALATDFGGGFVIGERLDCTTEDGSSPGIFCAGSAVFYMTDCKFTTGKATGIIVAHDHSVVVLNNCEVNAAGDAISGLQALPNPASSDGSAAYVFGGKLTSKGGAVVGENGGRTVVNLIGVECTPGKDTAISCSRSNGILTVNLWDTELTGNIECGEGCTLTVNLYAGAKLTGEVTGEGTLEINVFDGGEYNGSYTANQAGAGEEAPVLGSFDDYLISCWASGSSNWTESKARDYATNVEPSIIANSAAVLVEEGASAKPFDAAVFNPSETGVDQSLLNIGGAYGFTVDQVFGGDGDSSGDAASAGDAASGGESAGDSAGESGGDSAGAPADSESAPAEGAPAEGEAAPAEGEAAPAEEAVSGATAKAPAEGEAAAPAGSSAIATIMTVGTAQAFTDEPVSEDDLKTILQAGLAAPSAINQQPWFFVAITNPDVVTEINNISSSASAAPAEGAPAEGDAASAGAPADGATSEGDAASGGESAGDSAGAPAGGTGAKAGFGDSPAAIIIYRNDNTSSPDADFDCGLAAQNMVIAAGALGYGVKIVSSPTMTLNGTNHDAICERLGVDPSLQVVAVLLIGRTDTDAVSSASTRDSLETKTVIVK